MQTEELWKQVPGYEGLYSVSNFGRVYSHGRARRMPNGSSSLQHYPAKMLAGGLTGKKRDRISVILWKAGASKPFRIAQLVMLAFVGPRPAGLEVLHWDGNARNDHLSNLRYGTHLENMRDAVRHGTANRGERVPTAKLDAGKVMAIRSDTRIARELAKQYGVHIDTIRAVRRRDSWRHV